MQKMSERLWICKVVPKYLQYKSCKISKDLVPMKRNVTNTLSVVEFLLIPQAVTIMRSQTRQLAAIYSKKYNNLL